MSNDKHDIDPELKLKLLEIEKEASNEIDKAKTPLRYALMGLVVFGIIPLFGITHLSAFQVTAGVLLFGFLGAFLFYLAGTCRNAKK
ncbi:MAG: hypothetical protein J6Q80_03750 [Lentisphaeria bacterium]|nr:hypothetical protein [Lentisphaeria bacterium]